MCMFEDAREGIETWVLQAEKLACGLLKEVSLKAVRGELSCGVIDWKLWMSYDSRYGVLNGNMSVVVSAEQLLQYSKLENADSVTQKNISCNFGWSALPITMMQSLKFGLHMLQYDEPWPPDSPMLWITWRATEKIPRLHLGLYACALEFWPVS